MKLAIVGSTGHINYVFAGLPKQNDVHIVGIAPGSEGESIDKLRKEVHRLQESVDEFSDYRVMLDKTQPDVVAVACYFSDHAQIVVEALGRRIHVFVEKPVATSLPDLERVKKTYASSNAHLAAMFGLRYNPAFFTAWKAMQEGVIGQVRLMHAQKSYRLGARGSMFTCRETYGGTIPWVGSHAIDWLYWFSGEQFQSVYASHSRQCNQGLGDLEASALCHFSLTNEVFGSVSIDYLRPNEAPSHDDDRIRLAGSSGVLEVCHGQVSLINSAQSGVQKLPIVTPEKDIFSDFLGQIRGEAPCLITAGDSFLITEACLKARESADTNQVVQFTSSR